IFQELKGLDPSSTSQIFMNALEAICKPETICPPSITSLQPL
ncbi:hypothetical protein C5S36_11795, partial [Candidatus Methanophagaceae archaeon]